MTLSNLFTPRHEHRVLALMLIVVHLSVWWDFGGAISRSLMLVHLGLFLLWQPLFNRERTVAFPGVAVFLLVTVAFVVWLNWGLMTFWLLLLAGLVGGRVTVGSRDRNIYLAALVFLVSEILIGCLPPMFGIRSLSDDFTLLFRYGLLIVPSVLFFVPSQRTSAASAQPVDFLYGLMISLLTIVLGLGSTLSMYLTGVEYPVALIQMVFIIAVFLFAIGWLWTPLSGLAGIAQLKERYLLNIGTPFEEWLGLVANAASVSPTPDAFMERAMALFADLSWVSGIEWRARRDPEGIAGRPSSHAFEYGHSGVEYVVYTHRPMGVALKLHCQLLLRLVTHFRLAKERERDHARDAQLRAVYETGARVTHDIKNLLQSLRGLTAMLNDENPDHRQEVQAMMRRQLPHLTNRLQLALDKLQARGDHAIIERPLDAWWKDFRERNQGDGISFDARIEDNPDIPVDLFDSVVENLLENARNKRQGEPGIHITVRLESDARRTELSVSDTGRSIDPGMAGALFDGPVSSKNGLGIGLYQAAAQARQLGYELKLNGGSDDGVCFVLRRDHVNDA